MNKNNLSVGITILLLCITVAPLSEKSVGNRSNSVDVPDFTRGSWKVNKPVSLDI